MNTLGPNEAFVLLETYQKKKMKILSLLLLIMCACVRGIPPGLLYEFEPPGVQYLPAEDDVSSKEIQLRVPVVFYGTTYSSIFVRHPRFVTTVSN